MRSVHSAKYLIGVEAEIAGDEIDHQRAGLAGLHAARPGFFRGFEFAKSLRQRARGEVAELVAADAAVVLHGVEPVGLLDLVGNVAVAAELIGAGNFQHRIPVDRRIDFRGFRGIRRRHGFEIELLAGLGFDLRRIGEAIAADPDRVFGLRQIGHDVAALIVGDDHLGEAGRQVVSSRRSPRRRLPDRSADVTTPPMSVFLIGTVVSARGCDKIKLPARQIAATLK